MANKSKSLDLVRIEDLLEYLLNNDSTKSLLNIS